MANNGDIRQKIKLEGEKEYSAALKEAQRNLRVLRSELKAETAELGKNATEQQKNEARTKSLQKQIKEQQKIVKTYEDALKEVRERYGDNEEAIAKWEIKLNDARATLGNMKSELDGIGKSFRTINTGAGSSVMEMNALGQSFERLSNIAGGMTDAIESAFTGVLGTIRETIGAVWGEIMDIAAMSDNYLDLAAYFGSSATEVQKWDRALKAAHNDMSSITSMISRLKYGGKADKVTEWFGISGENYTNDLEYVEAVLSKMAEDKAEMVANGTWGDAMGDIFGAKKVQEIDSLLSDWDEIQRNLAEFDVENGGVGLTEDELQTMSDLYSQVGLLQEKWNAFKQSVATKIFGKLALDLTSNFQGALDALIAFMDADSEEEREKALDDFQKNIEEAFTKIGEAIQAAGEALDRAGEQLQGSENSYVRLLGKILSGISDAMEWITTEGNLEKVLNFFRAIFDLWLVGKGAEFITKITNVASSLGTIINYGRRWLNGGSDGGTDGGGTDGGVDGPTLPLRKTWGQKVKTAAKEAIEKAGWTAGELVAAAMTSPVGAATAAVMSVVPLIMRTAENAELHKKMEDIYGEEYTEATATEKTMIEAGMTPGAAKTMTQLNEDLGKHDVTNDIRDGMDQFARDAEDAIVEVFAPVSDLIQTLTKPGGGGGGGGGTFMYEMDVEGYPWRGRLGASADWWTNNSTPGSESKIGNIIAALPGSIQNSMANVKVVMDGEKVGTLVAPYVSQRIARDTA